MTQKEITWFSILKGTIFLFVVLFGLLILFSVYQLFFVYFDSIEDFNHGWLAFKTAIAATSPLYFKMILLIVVMLCLSKIVLDCVARLKEKS